MDGDYVLPVNLRINQIIVYYFKDVITIIVVLAKFKSSFFCCRPNYSSLHSKLLSLSKKLLD